MGDYGDYCRDIRDSTSAYKAKRSAECERKNTDLLNKHKIPYEEKNHGNHLVINVRGLRVDFWPTTGTWITGDGTRGHGAWPIVQMFESGSHV